MQKKCVLAVMQLCEPHAARDIQINHLGPMEYSRPRLVYQEFLMPIRTSRICGAESAMFVNGGTKIFQASPDKWRTIQW
jgi:hypothetical protein